MSAAAKAKYGAPQLMIYWADLLRALQTAQADRDANHVQSVQRFESGISSVAATVRGMSGRSSPP